MVTKNKKIKYIAWSDFDKTLLKNLVRFSASAKDLVKDFNDLADTKRSVGAIKSRIFSDEIEASANIKKELESLYRKEGPKDSKKSGYSYSRTKTNPSPTISPAVVEKALEIKTTLSGVDEASIKSILLAHTKGNIPASDALLKLKRIVITK